MPDPLQLAIQLAVNLLPVGASCHLLDFYGACTYDINVFSLSNIFYARESTSPSTLVFTSQCCTPALRVNARLLHGREI